MLQVEFPGKQSGTLRFVCRSFIGVNLSSTTWEEAEEAGLGGGRLKLWEYSCISDLSRGSQLLALGTSFMEMSFPLTGCVCVWGGWFWDSSALHLLCTFYLLPLLIWQEALVHDPEVGDIWDAPELQWSFRDHSKQAPGLCIPISTSHWVCVPSGREKYWVKQLSLAKGTFQRNAALNSE